MKKLKQLSLNNDGLMEHIRKQQELEISKISGVPAKYLGLGIQQIVGAECIKIFGGIEFIEKFMKSLPKHMKK